MTDQLQKFILERAGVRGVLVQLEQVWKDARAHTDYPTEVASLLGRSLAAAALLTGTIKFEGRLSIQLRSESGLRLLFVECTEQGRLRGLARWDEAAGDIAPRLPTDALLAITIEQTDTDLRQQGLIAADGGDLVAAFEQYFEQSEQLPTRIVLVQRDGVCAGLLLQPLAMEDGSGARRDEDGWNRIGHLLATLTDAELAGLEPEQVLLRLFHEEGVRVFDPRPLQFACSCSRERVGNMLRGLGRDEVDATLLEQGEVAVTCEFCNNVYRYDPIDIAELFAVETLVPGSSKAH